MKNSLPRFVALAAAAGFLGTAGSAVAQGNPAGPSAGMGRALIKIFGDVKAFSAKADMKVTQAGPKEMLSGTVGFALLDGKTRMEMDLTQMKSAQMPPEVTAQLKQMGMDINIVLSVPEKKLTYLVYPSLKAYVEMPLPKEQAAVTEAGLKMEKKEIGKETIDGHPCVKNKIIVTDETGKKNEATTWNAIDMKDFPIQTEFVEQGTTVMMRYKDIKFVKPDGKLFEAPVGFTKYATPQEMMQTEVLKRLSGK